MVTVHDVEQGSEAWHQLRRDRYTGSNAIKLLRFGATEYARAAPSLFGGNFYTKRGHILEDEAIELYNAITKKLATRPGFVTNDRYPNCGYSPDGIDGTAENNRVSGTLLECKAFNEKKHRAIAAGDIPAEILAQIHFGLLICDLKEAKLVLYNPDLDAREALVIIDINYNRHIINNFKRKLQEAGSAIHTEAAKN